MSYAKILGEHRLGFPAVHVTAEFQKPLLHGDVIDVEVAVSTLGQTSFACHYRILRDRDVCATATITTAVVSIDGMKAIPIPDNLRAFLKGYLEEGR